MERLLDGAAAALPTANLEQVKAGSLELDLCRIKSFGALALCSERAS